MTKPLEDIKYKRGDTKPLRIRIKSPDTKEYVDLTGCSFVLAIDSLPDPPDTSTNIANITGTIDPDQVANRGVVTFYPTATDTDHIGTFYYEIQMTDAAGHDITLNSDPLIWTFSQDLVK